MHFLFFLFYVDISLSTTLVQQRFSHGSIDPRCVTRAKKNATSKDRTRETGRLKNIQKEQSVSRYLRRDKFLRASFLAILTFLFHFLKKNKKNRHLRRFIQFATSKVRLNSPRYFPFPSFISPGIFFFAPRFVLFDVASSLFPPPSLPLQFDFRHNASQHGRRNHKISKIRIDIALSRAQQRRSRVFSPLLSSFPRQEWRGSFLLTPARGGWG